ncbi:P-selectin isoform X3 [Cynoglossus semilaevis]|uniref:E-selectin n=1 Tax=Cynoglossus semilaevis TaxID=244447 RepID=A0A3P8UAM4_CYNSE|nr:P-selectin isoform X3 [Cynoglossus semilaevis]
MMFQKSLHVGHICQKVLMAAMLVFFQDQRTAQAWTYNYSTSPNQRWTQARQWCRNHFTDIVSIHSQEETDFINELLPLHTKYYWIGISRVTSGVWTWEDTNETVPEAFQNWAEGEPDDIPDQDCVEIYIKRDKDTARWNNEKCNSRKGTVCYSASCKQDSCSVYAACVETVGNYTCQCHPGFFGPRCDDAISCEPLADPENGFHDCFHPHGSYRFKSSCYFFCDLGFHLVGAPQVFCQDTEHWDHTAPLCQAVQCPVLDNTNTSRGRLNCSHPIAPYSYNSTCEVICDEGHELSGEGQIRCDHTGWWTASVPTCEVVQCSSLQPPPHAAALQCQDPIAENSYGSTCTTECEEGFDLIGSNVTKCSSRGNWTHTLPVCQAKRCLSLTSPVNGTLTCSTPHGQFSFGSRCTSTCDEGFLLKGTADTECTSLGTWSSDVPSCTAKRCLTLTSPVHGSLFCSHPYGNFSFQSHCTSTCDEGFLLNGTRTTQCTSTGQWSADTPNCLVKTCPRLDSPPHGSLLCSDPHGEFSFASRCTSSCDDGFQLNGRADTECTSAGKWSRKKAKCKARPCPLLAKAPHRGRMNCSHPHSDFSYESHCNFECSEGFLLIGTPTVTCNSSGNWSQDLPTCQLVQCEAINTTSLPMSMNCTHPLGNFSFASYCLLSCDDGFSMNGSGGLLCTSTGVWSDTLPKCLDDSPVAGAIFFSTGFRVLYISVPIFLFLVGLAVFIFTRFKSKGALIMAAPLYEEHWNPAFES